MIEGMLLAEKMIGAAGQNSKRENDAVRERMLIDAITWAREERAKDPLRRRDKNEARAIRADVNKFLLAHHEQLTAIVKHMKKPPAIPSYPKGVDEKTIRHHLNKAPLSRE